MSSSNRRLAERVTFSRGIDAHMMAIDGTWRGACVVEGISNTGVRLLLDGSIEGLNLKEFFLLLSSTGLAYRRCELAWVNGDEVGASFSKAADSDKAKGRGRVGSVGRG